MDEKDFEKYETLRTNEGRRMFLENHIRFPCHTWDFEYVWTEIEEMVYLTISSGNKTKFFQNTKPEVTIMKITFKYKDDAVIIFINTVKNKNENSKGCCFYGDLKYQKDYLVTKEGIRDLLGKINDHINLNQHFWTINM